LLELRRVAKKKKNVDDTHWQLQWAGVLEVGLKLIDLRTLGS
jgi:hypothetical protein